MNTSVTACKRLNLPIFKSLTSEISLIQSPRTTLCGERKLRATGGLNLVLLHLEVVIVSWVRCSSLLVVRDDTLEGMVTSLRLLGDDTSGPRTWVGGLSLVLERSLTAWAPTLGLAAGVDPHAVEGACA